MKSDFPKVYKVGNISADNKRLELQDKYHRAVDQFIVPPYVVFFADIDDYKTRKLISLLRQKYGKSPRVYSGFA